MLKSRQSLFNCAAALIAIGAAVFLVLLSAYTPWPRVVGKWLSIDEWPQSLSLRRPANNRLANEWQQPCGYFGARGVARVPLIQNYYAHTLNRTSVYAMIDENFSGDVQREFAEEARASRMLWPDPLSSGSYEEICQAVQRRIHEYPAGIPLPRHVVFAEVGWPFPAFTYCRDFAWNDLPQHAVIYGDEGWLEPSEWNERFPTTPIARGLVLDLLFYTLVAYFPSALVVAGCRKATRSVQRVMHGRRERRAGTSLCPHCHYPTLTPSAPCPECGLIQTESGSP